MNSAIIHKDVQDFIDSNLNSEITKLILKGSPFKEVSIQELANQIIAKKKSKAKLSTWFNAKNIYFPPKISIEQTSSEITAAYKSKIVSGNSFIDITGGFGVDCFYFSKQFKKVTHCEINKELSHIVAHNYKSLQANNIEVIPENGFEYLKATNLKYDCIYIDPSRRNDAKGKVFLLKDCLPVVPPKIDFFFTKTDTILIKVSPILDITSTLKELKNVKEVHVVSVNNEVKELLFLLKKNYNKAITIKTLNHQKECVQTFDFVLHEAVNAKYAEPQTYLYEPNASILKSGAFLQVSQQFNVNKLHQHSHLYTSTDFINFPGRIFEIHHVISYDKKKIKKLVPLNKANITTRNFPKTVAQIRKETKIKDGGNIYIFCTTNIKNELITIICDKKRHDS